MSERVVWLVGATGLVGRETLTMLLACQTVASVVTWTRRAVGLEHSKLVEHVVDLDDLESATQGQRADAAVCCLGTTMKVAGSKEAFRRVDYDYPLAFAHAAKRAGAKKFVIVTALGADEKSFVFYNRVKGEVEQALRGIGFESLAIARPSLLLGERKENRLGERLFAPVSKLLPARYRGIEARVVARALVRLVEEPNEGVRVALSDELQVLGA